MRSVQLANHQLQQTAHLVSRARARDQRLVLSAHLVPVRTVITGVVKIVAQVRPTLLEHLHLLARKIDVQLSRDRQRTRPPFEIHHADPAVFEIEDLLVVRRKLGPVLRTRGRRQLLRHDRFAR